MVALLLQFLFSEKSVGAIYMEETLFLTQFGVFYLLIVLPSEYGINICGIDKTVQTTDLSGFQPVYTRWEFSPLYCKQQNMLSLQPALQRHQQVLCNFL